MTDKYKPNVRIVNGIGHRPVDAGS